MKHPATTFPLRYSAALRRHLHASDGKPPGDLRSLVRMTDGAASALHTIAQAHMLVLRELLPTAPASDQQARLLRRSEPFLAHALVAIDRGTRDDAAALLQAAGVERRHRSTASAVALRRLRTAETRRRKAENDRDRNACDYRHLLAVSERTRRRLRRMAHLALAAQEDERRALSRELHDKVAQVLTSINVQLAIVGKASSLNAADLRLRLAHTQRCVKRSVGVIHRFARHLRPVVLDDLGLEAAVRSLIGALPGRRHLRITLVAETGADFSDTRKRTALFRVAQEALTNVVRHAGASTVSVHLRRLPHAVELEIGDDGRSFDVEHALDSKSRHHLGLLGMQERLEMVGGTLSIDSRTGLGTTVRATVPHHRTSLPRTV